MTELVFDDTEAPRQGVEPGAMGRMSTTIQQLRNDINALQRGSQLRNASISGGEGLRILDDDGTLQAQISPDRKVTIFDQSGVPVVRMGAMEETGPQSYGIEVRIGASWIQLGSQNMTWANVGDKPGWAADTASIAATHISGTVANAAVANVAGMADGSQYGWTNNVAGTQFYAVWVGNDGGFHFGRNTSSAKYKMNIRTRPINRGVLAIEQVTFDRKPQLRGPAEGEGPANLIQGAVDEYGAIAEQVAKVFPEVVQYFDGEIDGVRYEMIGLGLVPIVREHDETLKKIRTRQGKIEQEQKKQAERLRIIEEMLGIAPGTTKETSK